MLDDEVLMLRWFILPLFLTACNAPTLQLHVDGPDRLRTVTEQAVALWATHHIDFELVSDTTPDTMHVRMSRDTDNLPPEEAFGWYEKTWQRVGEVIMVDDPALSECMVAHELGHSLGMNHVSDGPSLLSPVIYQKHNPTGVDDCVWSSADQAELCRVFDCHEL